MSRYQWAWLQCLHREFWELGCGMYVFIGGQRLRAGLLREHRSGSGGEAGAAGV